MTLKGLTEEYNEIRRSMSMKPVALWRGSKDSLRQKIAELRGKATGAAGVGRFVRAELEAVDAGTGRGRTYEEILARAREAFPGARTTIKCVRWYAKDMRGKGRPLPARPRSGRDRAMREGRDAGRDS